MQRELAKKVGKWVKMIYVDRKGIFTQRTVYVQRVDGEYLIAYCGEKKSPRKFRIDNILSVLPARRVG